MVLVLFYVFWLAKLVLQLAADSARLGPYQFALLLCFMTGPILVMPKEMHHAVFDAAWRHYDSQPTPKPKSALQHTEKNKIFKILGLA